LSAYGRLYVFLLGDRWIWTTQANLESTVGLVAMAGKGVSVLVPPTNDFGKVLSGMNGTRNRRWPPEIISAVNSELVIQLIPSKLHRGSASRCQL
jgi:hypothetical protein